MTANQSNAQTEEKRFRLVKFFAYTSFIVLLLVSFPFSILLSRNAKETLLKGYENYALMLGENLSHQIYQNFAIPIFIRYGEISLRQEKQQELLDQVVRNTVHGFNIDSVVIYDISKGLVSYSTDPDMVGQKRTANPGYEKAVMGEHSSGLISGDGFLWGLGVETGGSEKKLRTYIPMRGMNPYTGEKTDILGILELTQDLTLEYRSVIKHQYVVFGLSIFSMALIFVALLLIVSKAEKIMVQRSEEQSALEAQLNQSERLAALGQMIAGVSHEIRNPLGIITSTAELLGQMAGADQTQKKLSEVITDASGRLNNIVTEFLDFARPQKPNRQECYLEEIMDNVLSFIRPELEKQGITVQNNLEGRTFRLYADPNLLYRALLNVFFNAIHAMSEGGKITLNARDEGTGYLIGIEDTGSGIQDEYMNKVFNPFFSTKDKGSGLGLSIVRNMVEAHNGAVWIESEPGSGTKVLMKLPKE